MAHLSRRSSLLVGRNRRTSIRLGIFNEFAIVEPAGARDGKVEICHIAAEDGRGLVVDLEGAGDNLWFLR